MIGNSADHAGDWDVTHSYDRSTERPSEVVVRAVAGTTNQDVSTIDPLYDAIEPDALDAVIDGDRNADTRLTFSYEGCRVHVDEDSVAVSAVGSEGGD